MASRTASHKADRKLEIANKTALTLSIEFFASYPTFHALRWSF